MSTLVFDVNGTLSDMTALSGRFANVGTSTRLAEIWFASMLMVAAHPWDIDGAANAGMSTAWINRDAASYPGHFTKPDFSVPSITALVDVVR